MQILLKEFFFSTFGSFNVSYQSVEQIINANKMSCLVIFASELLVILPPPSLPPFQLFPFTPSFAALQLPHPRLKSSKTRLLSSPRPFLLSVTTAASAAAAPETLWRRSLNSRVPSSPPSLNWRAFRKHRRRRRRRRQR